MQEALTGLWVAVATFVPRLLLFVVILVVGFIVAKAAAKGIDKVLTRVGFDRAVERGGIKRALEKSSLDASAIVGKIVYYFLLLFVLQFAFGVFGPNPITDLLTAIITFLPRLFVALVIIVIAAAVAAGAKGLIQNTLGELSYGKVLANIAGVFILGLGIIAALNQVGIATTVTTPVLIAVLATVGGILIVGVGGGLIKPMQQRWEGYLSKAEEEAPKIAEHAAAAPSVTEQAAEARDKAQQLYDQHDPAANPTPQQPAPSQQSYAGQGYEQQGHEQQQGSGQQGYVDQGYGQQPGAAGQPTQPSGEYGAYGDGRGTAGPDYGRTDNR